MNDLPLNALRAFAAIRVHGGVRAAARELGIAHSAVSRHLAELESWLGVTLIEPGAGRRGGTFTVQGHALGDAAVTGLREIAGAVAAVREMKSARSVTISATASVAARWLLPRLPAFEAAYRGIEVSVVVEQKLDDLGASAIDIAIRIGRGPWPGVRCEPMMGDELYPVMSPSLHATTGRPRTPEALVGLRLLHDRDPSASWDTWRRVHGPHALDVRRGPRFASSDLVLRAAAQRLGVALARDRLARDDIASGALVRPIAGLAVELADAYWIVRPDRAPSRAASVVVDWLRGEGARR
jgi:LysR family transcriptional regulator, glycine cleavage system transcriptional activator